MNTKLIVGASVLLLAMSATPVLGYNDFRDVVLPGGVDETTATGQGAGLAFCERVSDDLSLNTPVYCEGNGFSAFFSDIGCSADFDPNPSPSPGILFFGDGVPDNQAGCLDDIDGTQPSGGAGDGNDAAKDAFATGHITISAVTGSGTLNYLIGNDRDDDDSVTTGDSDGSNDLTDENGSDAGTPCNGDPARSGCYDDEFLASPIGGVTVPGTHTSNTFCFTRDRDHAGNDWDDIVVFLGANIPSVAYVGIARVTLDVTSTNTPCIRSGHSDSDAEFGGAPLVSTSGTFFDCEIIHLPILAGGTAGQSASCDAIVCSILGVTGEILVAAVGPTIETTAAGNSPCTVNVSANSAAPGPVGVAGVFDVFSASWSGSASGTYTCTATDSSGSGGIGVCIASVV